MDQQSLGKFRRALKEQRDVLHLRLVLTRESQRLSPSEIKDEGDRGNASTANEMSAIQQTRAQTLLTDINAALDRIDAGTFSECLNCDREISAKRLAAAPWARYCITCQELIDGMK
jgi:DnaK suppressor protein